MGAVVWRWGRQGEEENRRRWTPLVVQVDVDDDEQVGEEGMCTMKGFILLFFKAGKVAITEAVEEDIMATESSTRDINPLIH